MTLVPASTAEEKLAALREIQDREDLRTRHLVYIDLAGFVIAHTDHERALADAGGATLDECPVHRWLSLVNPSTRPGIYRIVKRLGDERHPYSLEVAKVHV